MIHKTKFNDYFKKAAQKEIENGGTVKFTAQSLTARFTSGYNDFETNLIVSPHTLGKWKKAYGWDKHKGRKLNCNINDSPHSHSDSCLIPLYPRRRFRISGIYAAVSHMTRILAEKTIREDARVYSYSHINWGIKPIVDDALDIALKEYGFDNEHPLMQRDRKRFISVYRPDLIKFTRSFRQLHRR